jgi:hypothetical protein|tara:strand:- start:5107 stop:5490 length:384 start_codon:yes stop_codon:yes gene_type:complete
MKKKPDNVANNPSLLPYGSNVGAPAIKPNDVGVWRSEKITKTNQYFEAKFNDIKEDYQKLIENYEWNKLVYSSDFKFEPEKGKIYFLYQKEDETLFLSLIEPDMWDKIFIGAFKLDSDNKWIKLEKA